MAAKPTNRRRTREDGFTLVEVLAATVITSILVLGLANLWTAVAGEVDGLTMRQKAIFVLNGQMERLTALYFHTDFAVFTTTDTTNYGSAAAYPDNRIIFRNDLPNYMPNGAADNFVVAAGGFAGAPGLPVLFDDNSGTDDDRNYVWIDKDRNVVGRLSWIETEVVIDSCDGNGEYSQSGSSPCYCPAWTGSGPGTRCREISVYLEYPFRWVSGAVVQQATRLEIIPLKTIVGRLL